MPGKDNASKARSSDPHSTKDENGAEKTEIEDLGGVAIVTQSVLYLGIISGGLVELLEIHESVHRLKSRWTPVIDAVSQLKTIIDTARGELYRSANPDRQLPPGLVGPLKDLEGCITETRQVMNACKFPVANRAAEGVPKRKDLLSSVRRCDITMNKMLRVFNAWMKAAHAFALDQLHSLECNISDRDSDDRMKVDRITSAGAQSDDTHVAAENVSDASRHGRINTPDHRSIPPRVGVAVQAQVGVPKMESPRAPPYRKYTVAVHAVPTNLTLDRVQIARLNAHIIPTPDALRSVHWLSYQPINKLRLSKTHSSIVLHVNSARIADRLVSSHVLLDGTLYRSEHITLRESLCYNCFNYGHIAAHCRRRSICGICAGGHPTRVCACPSTEATCLDVARCTHVILKCAVPSCGGPHGANDRTSCPLQWIHSGYIDPFLYDASPADQHLYEIDMIFRLYITSAYITSEYMIRADLESRRSYKKGRQCM